MTGRDRDRREGAGRDGGTVRVRLAALLASGLALPAILTASTIFAAPVEPQRREPPETRSTPEFAGHSVTDFPRVRHLVERAEREFSAGRLDAAFDSLQEVIDRHENQIYQGADGIFHGARDYALGLLAKLPPDALDAYRRRYDHTAEKLFRRAADEQDESLLLELVRRYLFTSFGPEALARLGSLHHERGEWEEAAYYYEESIHPMWGVEPTAEILLRIGDCLARVGDAAGVERIGKRVAALDSAATVRIEGRDVPALDGQRQLTERAKAEDARLARESSWPQVGGDPTHTKVAPAYRGPWSNAIVVPLSFASFAPRPMSSRRAFIASRYLPDPSLMKPPFEPVADNAVVFVHDGLQIRAINLLNGKLKWFFTALEEPTWFPHPRITFAAACAGDAVYAALETPVDDVVLDYQYTPIKVPLPQRKLFALDAESGRLLWTHAAPNSTDPETLEFLAKASVCTPPLVWRERLYVGASYFEGKIHSYVCCFDRRTGSLLWKTLVCTGQQELNMFGNQFLEYVASPLALADGTLYFTTNLGLVAAMDARSGSIRWIADYPILPLPSSQGFQPEVRPTTWYRNPVIVSDGVLIVTPLDADALFAFDRETGRRLWTYDRTDRFRRRWAYEYTLGVCKGLLFLAGTQIQAVRVSSGTPAWTLPFPNAGEEASGRGTVCEDAVICPTQYGNYVVDPATGELLAAPAPWEHGVLQAGNLVSLGDFFLCASTETLSIFVRWEEIFAKLKRTLDEHPDDVETHLRLADGYAHAGMFPPALEHYERVFRLTLDDPHALEAHLRAQRGLHQTWRERGCREIDEESWVAAEESLRTALGFAFDDESLVRTYLDFEALYARVERRDKQRALYEEMLEQIPHVLQPLEGPDLPVPAGFYALTRLAELDFQDRRPVESVGRYQRILREFRNVIYRGVRAGEFAKDRIDYVVRTFGPDAYAPYQKEAAQLLSQARESRDPALFEKVLSDYPNSAQTEPCLLELSVVLREEGRFGDALRRLRAFLADFPQSALRRDVLDEIVGCYENLRFPSAAAYVRALVDPRSRRLAPGPEAPTGRSTSGDPSPFRMVWEAVFALQGGLDLIDPVGEPGPFFDEHVLVKGARSVFCVRLLTMETLWERTDLPLMNDSTVAVQDGRAVLATRDGRVVCFDPETGDDYWSQELEDPLFDLAAAPGTVMVVTRKGSSGRSRFDLEAFDMATGERAWTKVLMGQFQKPLDISTGRLLVRTSNVPARILALESFSGDYIWDATVDRSNLDPIALGDDRLVYPAATYVLRCVDLPSRRDLWTFSRGTDRIHFAIPCGDGIAIRTADTLDLVDGETGDVRWSVRLPEKTDLERIRSLDLDPSGLLILKSEDRESNNALLALRADDGTEAWRLPLPRNPLYLKRLHRAGEVLALEMTEYHPESRIRVLVVNAESGAEVQTLEFEGSARSDLILGEKDMVIATGNSLHFYGRTGE